MAFRILFAVICSSYHIDVKFDFKYIDEKIWKAVYTCNRQSLKSYNKRRVALMHDIYYYVKVSMYADKFDVKYPQFHIKSEWADYDPRKKKAITKTHNLIQKRLQIFVNKGLMTRDVYENVFGGILPCWYVNTPTEIVERKLNRNQDT